MIDFSNHKFRCSSLGSIMTNQRGKNDTKTPDELSETAKQELIKIYVYAVYGRDKEIHSKYIEKGLAVEEDSITLLSRIDHKLLIKNTERFSNDFITGEPDVVDPLYDTKSCWDIHSFYEHKTKPLKKEYEYQITGYAELTGKDSGTVAFCLIDTPLGMIEHAKRNLLFKMNCTSSESPEYLEAAASLEKEMTFNDIPMEERVHKVRVARDPKEIQKVYERIKLCREWLNLFAESQVSKPVLV